MLHTTIFFTHHPRLQRSMLSVYKCIKTVIALQKYFPIMNRRLGYLSRFLRCTPLKNFRLFLHSVIFFQLFSIQTFGYRGSTESPCSSKSIQNQFPVPVSLLFLVHLKYLLHQKPGLLQEHLLLNFRLA